MRKRRVNIKTHQLLIILSLFSFYWVKSQSHPVADSLFRILDMNPTDSIVYSELNNIINTLYYQDADLAMKLAQKELKYAQQANYYYAQGKSLLNIGIVYDLKGKYDSAIIYYNATLELAEEKQMNNIKGDIYNNFSITLAVLGNMEESISYALKALQIFEQMKDSSRIARIYNNLGARYSEMEYYDQALEYYQKAALINEKLKYDRKLAFNYGNIGLLYYDLHQDEKALEYFKKSILLQDTVNDKFNYAIAQHNLALAYQRLHQYDKALNYDRLALEIATEINDELGKVMYINGLASTNRDMGKSQKALDYFYQAEKLAKKVGARYYLINIYANIAELQAVLNNYQQAYLYNQKYNLLNDSIMITEKDKAISKIKEFEDDKKRKEIELLTKDSEIQKLNLKRQKILRNSISAVGILILLLAIGLLNRYRYVRKTRNELSEKNIIINKEKERSEELLLNILPAQTAEELKSTGQSEARHFELATVMFTDFKGFTYMAEKLSPQELVDEIDFCFKQFDQIISKHNIEKIKTIGDAYMCAGGLPIANDTNPADVVRAGIEIQNFMNDIKQKRKAKNEPYFELRLGINTGPVVAGIVGTKKFQYDIWGDTVNIASRMESSGEVGKVNISQMTYEKVKDQFNCEHRGKIEAKNKGAIDMYFVETRNQITVS